MRSVSRSRLMTVGLGLGAVGGVVGSLLLERSALTVAHDVAGEGSEEQPSWGVGSYRSHWTTFPISPDDAVHVSSGSLIRSVGKLR